MATKMKGNMFDTAAEQREEEQAKITETVTKTRPAAGAEGEKGKMTLSISESDRLLVKQYALTHRTTVSELLHTWIQAHCVENDGRR